MSGAHATILVTNLQSTPVSPGFVYPPPAGTSRQVIFHELWLKKQVTTNQSDPCYQTQLQACWIELGYKAENTGGGQELVYFWADSRPNHGDYHEHTLGLVEGQDIGQRGEFSIQRQDSSTWRVAASIPGHDTYEDLSTSNAYQPDYWQVGEEVSGTMGAASGVTGLDSQGQWTNSYWVDQVGQQFFETSTGSQLVLYNPSTVGGAGWATNPSFTDPGGLWVATFNYP